MPNNNYILTSSGSFLSEDELYHWGIKGMKWGVRRYQNEDGSLTAAGKKRYDKMSDNQLQKSLYKQVKKARSQQSDWSNQWNVSNTIGKNSKAVADRYREDLRKHQSSDEYKKAVKKMNTLDKRAERGEIDLDQYNKEYEKIQKSVYSPELDTSVRITGKGRQYSKEYLNKYGNDLNVAYLKDLGYNDSTAKKFAARVLKANKKLLNGM